MKKRKLWCFILCIIFVLAVLLVISFNNLGLIKNAAEFKIQRAFALLDIFTNITIIGAIGYLIQFAISDNDIEKLSKVTTVIISDEKTGTEIEVNGKIEEIKIINT